MNVEELVRELQYYIAAGKGKLPVVAHTYYNGTPLTREIVEVARDVERTGETTEIVLLDENLRIMK